MLFSVGYEERSVEELVALLVEHEIAVLVDVRMHAISRKRGFSKQALSEALSGVGIRYEHERSLGNPRDNREAFRRGEASARDRYLAHLRSEGQEGFKHLISLARASRVAVLCYERSHDSCHRACILDMARTHVPRMGIIRL